MEIILVDQLLDTGDENWSRRSCGICVLKMLMVFKKPELHSVPVMTLLNQALDADGYIKNIGWKHKALVNLAASYGVAMDFQKKFFDTPEKKKEGIKIINRILGSGLSRFSLLTKSELENRGSADSDRASSTESGLIPLASGPVAVSVLKEFNQSDTAHLVIVEKTKKFGPFVRGYYIVDPYPGTRGNKYTVSKKEFLSGWRGGMIWLE